MSSMSEESLTNSKDKIQGQEPADVKGGLHDMRKSIDALIQWANELRENRASGYGREMSLVHTKLQEAKMWTGKCLEQIGSELPEEFRDKADTETEDKAE